MKAEIIPATLKFKKPAGTSRGIYTERKVWYIKLQDGEKTGLGECAPLPKLSVDDVPDYEQKLHKLVELAVSRMNRDSEEPIPYDDLVCYPSILFGLETALKDLYSENGKLWDSPFSRGEKGIEINGLIWMGSHDAMLEQIHTKLEKGFQCIKLKIGAIDFEEEMDLLEFIRKHYSAEQITLRVDANGGFKPEDALDKLERLATLDLHSIEQPIMAGQWDEMARLCASTPLPIALDEELIPCVTLEDKTRMLDRVRPQYIILKPSLHGGIAGCSEWIRLAEERGIGWWITSALESNVGLNAIAQWCGSLGTTLPQGLGTGLLFTENADLGLEIRGDQLWRNLP